MLCSAAVGMAGRRHGWAGRTEPQGGLGMTLTYGFEPDPYNKYLFYPGFSEAMVCPIMTIVGKQWFP
jgi:hypothetical protein